MNIKQLLEPSVLGFFTHFEGTEVIAFRGTEPQPVNIFSLFVASDRRQCPPPSFAFLNGTERLVMKSLKDWKFGVTRYFLPLADLLSRLDELSEGNQWRPIGKPLTVGQLSPLPAQFVPPDSFRGVPWNRVLKNNFWNGSYLLEWSDRSKTALQPLFDDQRRLQELSALVQTFVPMELASLSDRLGNIAVQLPVDVIMAKFAKHGNDGVQLSIGWHPDAKPRPLRVSCSMEFDNILSGYTSATIVTEPQTVLPMPSQRGTHRAILWDDQTGVILAATGEGVFVNTIGLNIHVRDPEPRIFTAPGDDGSDASQRIELSGLALSSVIGEIESDDTGGWTRKRMYAGEVTRLAAERRFVQYRAEPGKERELRQKAFADLGHIINQNSRSGCWLWDPYLTADDILRTLFCCQFSGADLRALTAAKQTNATGLKADFVAVQRARLEATAGNRQGLRLEYRARIGQSGWGFHDRFLIFPQIDRGASAWSLGTSVNSFGTEHHILQRVDDGQLIADAFLDLWEQLNKPEHLVWKTP